jgi:hypothetical protein
MQDRPELIAWLLASAGCGRAARPIASCGVPQRRSLHGPARLLTAGVAAFLAAVATLSLTPWIWLRWYRTAPTYRVLDLLEDAESTMNAAALGVGLVGVLAALGGFVTWLYRARRNLEAAPGPRLAWGPGWALLGWLIPVANLVIPPLVVAEVTRHSLARAGRPGVVGVALALGWWVSLVGLVALGYLGGGVTSEQVAILRSGRAEDPVDPQVREQYLRLHGVDPPSWDVGLGLGLLAAAGVLVVVLARRVASAQRRAGLDTEP